MEISVCFKPSEPNIICLLCVVHRQDRKHWIKINSTDQESFGLTEGRKHYGFYEHIHLTCTC